MADEQAFGHGHPASGTKPAWRNLRLKKTQK
jgi:hypothetical protein